MIRISFAAVICFLPLQPCLADSSPSQLPERTVVWTMRRLQEIKIPEVELKETSIRKILEFLKQRDMELSVGHEVNVSGELLGAAFDNKVDLTAKDVSLADILATAAEAAQCDLEIGHGTVTFKPRKEEVSLAVVSKDKGKAKGQGFELAIANVTASALAYASDPKSKEGVPAIVIEEWKDGKWASLVAERPAAEIGSTDLGAKHKVYRKVDLTPVLDSGHPFRISLQFSAVGAEADGRKDRKTVYSPSYYFREGWLMNAGPLQ